MKSLMTAIDSTGAETPLQLDASGNLKVTGGGGGGGGSASVQVGVPVSRSGTIAAANTSQTLMAGNVARNGFQVQNLSTADLWINELGAAAVAGQPSLRIPAGGLYESPLYMKPSAAVSILGSVPGQAFAAREY